MEWSGMITIRKLIVRMLTTKASPVCGNVQKNAHDTPKTVAGVADPGVWDEPTGVNDPGYRIKPATI